MGLDMYLTRMAKVEGLTMQQMIDIQKYLDWRDNEDARKYTLKEWCGVDPKKLQSKKLIHYYEDNYNHTPSEDVGYWRKANQIHNWFVINVQGGEDDCGCYEVSREQLEDLLECCRIVKRECNLIDGKVKVSEYYQDGKWHVEYDDGKVLDNVDIAKEYLPTVGGFFFGDTNYDEWYMKDIDDTIQIIENVLQTTDFEKQMILYSSSW